MSWREGIISPGRDLQEARSHANEAIQLLDHPLEIVVSYLDVAGQLSTLLHKRMNYVT